ncbi:MAG: type II toxin-antitoxin system RelE/ParE family toxin [Thiohalocapsa sp.]
MRVDYSANAVSDLRGIADYYARAENSATGERVAARIREVIARIARMPQSGRPVVARRGVRVVSLLHYPYNIFYAVGGDSVRILHIRHTARRPWISDQS